MRELKISLLRGLLVMVMLGLFTKFKLMVDVNPFVVILAMGGITTVVSLIVSLLMKRFIPKLSDPENLYSLKWLTIEYLFSIPIMGSLAFTFLSWYATGDSFTIWKLDGEHFSFWVLFNAVGCTTLVLMPIYILNLVYYRKCQLAIEIEKFQALNPLLEEIRAKMSMDIRDEFALPSTPLLIGSKEAIDFSPSEILYVESIANYVGIVYLKDGEVCRKKLRSSLKDIETALEAFPYIVHIHRAFLVNIKFITRVSGNASGYKIEMYGCSKALPVSKANIPAFKQKIQDMSQTLQ